MPNVTIDGIEYTPVRDTDEELRIVIVDNRGLTFVGYTNIYNPDNGIILIRKARCIIRWGTKKHIAELVNGPLEETVLGAVADVEVSGIIASYRVAGDWHD